jgi:hypothetical protein
MRNESNQTGKELYFEWYEIHIRLKGNKTRAYLSVEDKPVFFQSQAN